MSTNDIASLFDEWNRAIQSGDPKRVAILYDTNAILVPTLSNKVRHNHNEIEDYFAHFRRLSVQYWLELDRKEIFDERRR